MIIASTLNIGCAACATPGNSTAAPACVPNPQPLITSLYTADPSAHVFGGTLYLYPSHDIDSPPADEESGGAYAMRDYHVLTLATPHGQASDEGEALTLSDVPWASRQLWAPDAAFANGVYYLYFPAKDKVGVFRIGVATSTSPTGPFASKGAPIGGTFSIDPCAFVDEDNATYLVFGGLWGGQLERWRTGAYDRHGREPAPTQPALGPRIARLGTDMSSIAGDARELSIVDATGKPLLAGDWDRRFFEAAWLHKRGGVYYLSYSTGTTHRLVYATSDRIEGPYVWRGRILDPVVGWTTHHSIVEWNGKWYLFYHDASLSDGRDNLRCVKMAELTYEPDGSIRKVTVR
jgi:hypothetical protein